MIGQTIGHYQILEKLGEGGMGVVYKATDTRLDRLVALKFLPEELSRSTSDAARFTQEAKAAAALNHPSICTIHGIEEVDGKQFIVMEFVDGQTLGDKKDWVNLKQAIDIGIQIADGLSAAHEKGITHRDIKPDNIMIRKDGIVQIMDFGLAKLRGVSNLTQHGSTVGTARYMSPEQVQGEDIDHRSDIFSLGVLLYELFSGQLPFKGVHETALLYEIVNVDPEPMSTVKAELPPELDTIVLECLAKEKADRYQSAAEIAKELRRFKRESSRQMASRVTRARSIPSLPATSSQPLASEQTKIASIVPWGLTGALFIVAALALWRPWSAPPAKPGLVHFTLSYASDAVVDTRVHPAVDISPDGSRIVYRAGTGLFLRNLSALEPIRLADVRDGMHPVFSPDGNAIAFFEAEDDLMRSSIDAGRPSLLSTLDKMAGSRRGLAWTHHGTILFSVAVGGLFEMNVTGGDIRELTQLDTSSGERTHRWPHVLPNGKAVIFTVGLVQSPDYYEDATIHAYEFETGHRKLLVKDASTARYSPTGHLLFTRSGILYGIRFDQDNLETVGEPVQLINGMAGDATSGAMHYALSSTGTLVYVPGTSGALRHNLVKIDHDGAVTRYPVPERQYYYPRISPDARRIAISIGSTREMDVHIYEISRNTLTRFTFGGLNSTPVWSPDGKLIAFSRRTRGDTTDIIVKHADGTGADKLLWSWVGDFADVSDWSPDGRTLLLQLGSSNSQNRLGGLRALDVESGRVTDPIPDEFAGESRASFSPDMKYVSFAATTAATANVFVQSMSSEGGFWQVSTGPGWAPRWSSDGRTLYYNDPRARVIKRVPIIPGSTFRFGEPTPVATAFRTPSIDPAFFPFDVFPDESGFLMVIAATDDDQKEIVVVMNWFEELKKAFGEE